MINISMNFCPDSIVEITLRNPHKTGDFFTYTIRPYDSAISRKWLDKLKALLRNKNVLEKSFTFLGFPFSQRTGEYLCEQLSAHIQTINKFSMLGGWDSLALERITINIDGQFSWPALSSESVQSQVLFNKLHHYFEVLQGTVENVSPYYLLAPVSVRYAIRNLNLLCHELESVVSTNKMARAQNYRVSCTQITSFINAERDHLAPEDLKSFTLYRNFGQVYLHWCQVGKTHLEVFSDGDEHIDASAVSGLKYYSGEFDVDFGPTTKGWPSFENKMAEFRTWLVQRGWDPDDARMGYGYCVVGEMDREKNFLGMNLEEIHFQLKDYHDIWKIAVYENGECTEHIFDYLADGDHYQELMLKESEHSSP